MTREMELANLAIELMRRMTQDEAIKQVILMATSEMKDAIISKLSSEIDGAVDSPDARDALLTDAIRWVGMATLKPTWPRD